MDNFVSRKGLVIVEILNGVKFVTLDILITHIQGTFDLEFKVIWGSFSVRLKMVCNLKTAGCRAKWSEICDPGTLLSHI